MRVVVAVLLILLAEGCANFQRYEPAPLDAEQVFREYKKRDLADPGLRDWLKEQGVDVSIWPQQSWDADGLCRVGQYFSTDLEQATTQIKITEAREKSAGNKPPHGVELQSEHHSDQGQGVSPWTLGAIFSWVYERPEKRQARIDAARAASQAERFKKSEINWQIRNTVQENYLDTVVASRQLMILAEEIEILEQGLATLERRLQLGHASEFEVSSSRLELQRLRLRMSELRIEEARARTQLALSAGLTAQGLEQVTLAGIDGTPLPDVNNPELALDRLQTRALKNRPDILRSMSEYAIAEAELNRAIQAQYPDITLSPGYIFDQNDHLWTFAAAWVLPIKARNQGPIAEAEARRLLKSQQFLALQTEVLGQVHSASLQYRTLLQTLSEAEGLLEEIKQREKKLQRQFDLGYVDQLTLSRQRLEVLTVQRAEDQIRLQLWRVFTALEGALMSSLR